MHNISTILKAYDIKGQDFEIRKYGSGHIHSTYLVENGRSQYILQAFNNKVFRFPERISANQFILGDHSGMKELPFALPLPFKNKEGPFFTLHNQQYYRMFPFIEGITKDAVDLTDQAYVAAEAFWIFTSTFLEVPTENLQEPIVDFHNLILRYRQLMDSIQHTALHID